MKPKPLVALNHLTVPVAISLFLHIATLSLAKRLSSAVCIEILEIDVSKRGNREAMDRSAEISTQCI
jgi:hypothetical protein